MTDERTTLIKDLQEQLHKGVLLQKGTQIGSALHHRMDHRLAQLRKIIQELSDELAEE